MWCGCHRERRLAPCVPFRLTAGSPESLYKSVYKKALHLQNKGALWIGIDDGTEY